MICNVFKSIIHSVYFSPLCAHKGKSFIKSISSQEYIIIIMHPLVYPINGDSSSNDFQAFDPLAFAEYIARMVGPQKESPISMSSSSSQTTKLPSKINTTFLAQELSRTDVPPVLLPSLLVDDGSTTSSTGNKQRMNTRAKKVDESASSSTNSTCSTSITIGKKRGVSISSDEYDPKLQHSRSLRPWDLEFLLKHNPDDTMSKIATKELSSLARKFEAMRMYNDWGCNNSYNRMREETFEASKNIAESTCTKEEKNNDFSQLYSDTISHMRVLIAMAEQLEKEQEEKNTKAEKPTHRPLNKKEFTEWMITYLKDNWTNPYPDRPAIMEIAEKTGAKYSTVNNWLINARTRKWKPSIQQAIDMQLPSATLERDSKNIFDERFLKKASKK